MKKWNGSKWIRPEKRRRLYKRDGFRCVYCEKGVEHGATLTLDHITPRELGGGNEATNLVTACRSCNSAKGALPVSEFITYLRDNGAETDGIAKRVRNSRRRKY